MSQVFDDEVGQSVLHALNDLSSQLSLHSTSNAAGNISRLIHTFLELLSSIIFQNFNIVFTPLIRLLLLFAALRHRRIRNNCRRARKS
jgi:hypothetical protein